MSANGSRRNHRAEEAAGEGGEQGERAKRRARPQPPPRGLPLRRRRRSGADSGADAASPGLIVDRVARHGELAAIWARDPFLSAGGDTRAPRRSGRGALAAAFAAEHASLGGGGGREVGRRRSSWP